MSEIPAIAPVSHMRIRQAELLRQAKDGPVVLIEKGSTPAAVLISPEKWNDMQRQIKQLEMLAESRRVLAEMASDPAKRISHEALRRQLKEKAPAD